MSVISNALVSVLTDKNLPSEGKLSSSSAEKLMELLRGAQKGELIIEAAIKGIVEGKGKFNLSHVGNLEIPIPVNTKLPESGTVNIKFSLQNEVISATFLLEEMGDAGQTQGLIEDAYHQLKQLGLPQTEQNLKAVKLLNEYHIEPSADKIKQLAEGSFLASKAIEMTEGEGFETTLLTKDQKVDMSKTLKNIVVQWLGQQAEGGKTNASTLENPAMLNSEPSKGGISLQLKGEAGAEAKGTQLNDAPQIVEKIVEPAQEARIGDTAQTVKDIKELLKQLNPKQLLPLIASDSKLNIENLLLSDQVFSGSKNIGQLKENLVLKLTEVFGKLEPSKELIQDIIRWVEEDPAALTFKNQLVQLETIIVKHSPEAFAEMKDSFEQLNKSMDFVQQMQNQMMAYHIPLQLGEHHTQVELYMNRRKGRQSQDEFKMFLALNTNEIGQVQVLITDQKSSVELQFKLETDELKAAFEDEKGALQETLEGYSEKPIKLKFVTHSKEPAILEAFKSLREDETTSIDVRV